MSWENTKYRIQPPPSDDDDPWTWANLKVSGVLTICILGLVGCGLAVAAFLL